MIVAAVEANVVCSAISGRRFLRFSYGGRTRIVYPCAHGELSSGNPGLRAHEVQLVDGRLRTAPGRLFRLDRMSAIALTDQPFEKPPPGYRRGDRSMASIHCEL